MKKLALALLALLVVAPAKADITGLQFVVSPIIGAPSGPMSGYAAGDVVTLQCAGYTWLTSPKVVIGSVTASGAPTAVAVINQGLANNSAPASLQVPCTQGATTGSGVGLNINVNMAVQAAQAIGPALTDFPGYVVGNWYVPYMHGATAYNGAPSPPGAGSIRLVPGFIKQRITISNLGARIVTLSGGGNVQIAIYAHNPITGKPFGPPLVSTASMSTGSAGNINAPASIQLDPGLYWFATNSDNGVVTYASPSVGTPQLGMLIGSSNQTNALNSTQSFLGYTVAQTFGTWPNLNGASFAEATGNGYMPYVAMQISSVP